MSTPLPKTRSGRPSNQSAQVASRRQAPLLRDLAINHGPIELLGRFFLKANAAATARGITLSLATLDELADVNRKNSSSWGALMPMFEPTSDRFERDTSFCILGTNQIGEIVATQAARLYALNETNLKTESENLRLLYGTGPVPGTARCTMSADKGSEITGNVAYSGCGWYRPDYRRLQLSAILPRISRVLALTLWDTQWTVSFIEWPLVHKGVGTRYGYKHLDDGVSMHGVLGSEFQGAVGWMTRSELMSDLNWFMDEFDVGSGSQDRRGDQERIATR